MSIIYHDSIHQNDVKYMEQVSSFNTNKQVVEDTSVALESLHKVGCSPIFLEALDGNNNGLSQLLGEDVQWQTMNTYELHQLKLKLQQRLEEENTAAVDNCGIAMESIWSNIKERLLLFTSFESERKNCIAVLTKQINSLESEQKKQLEDMTVSYDTFDYKTASLVVNNLKRTIDLCNKNISFIQRFIKTPEDELSDMDKEYISELKEKFESATLGNDDAVTFFSDLIKAKTPSGKTLKELGYTVGTIASLATDVQRNVMNFYRQLSVMTKTNERLGNAEAKRGSYGTSDLWEIYMSIFKVLRDADRCYKIIESHLFRTQQKVIHLLKKSGYQETSENQY